MNLKTCVEGSGKRLRGEVANFYAATMSSKASRQGPRQDSGEILSRCLLGLMQSLGAKGWKVSVEHRAGGSYVDIHLLLRRERKAVLIELKSSEKEGDMKRDAIGRSSRNKTFRISIVLEDYRNPEGLLNICTLREYGIAGCHLKYDTWSSILKVNG